MRSKLSWILAAALCLGTSLSAAESEDASNTAPSKRPSFFGRIFGNRSREAEAAQPAQASSNAPKKTPNAPAPKPEAPAPTDPKTEAKPAPKKAASKDKAAEAPKTEQERFEAARKAAAEDARIAELRTKAEASANNAESHRLMRAYLRSLYGKMRSLEPTLSERIDLTEKAALKLVPESPQ
jgi:outer membrane biosynthesis protein TonB